jgi:hypothetical protein
VVSGRYQFRLFQYNTVQPVLYSVMLLRRALRSVLNEIDPLGEDDALRRMVIMGHSQGGLLTKLMAIRSGNRFWENVTDEPFEKVEMAPESRELLREATFFEPVPTLRRVVFIATPHRGSYQATGWALDHIRRFITLPGTLVSQFQGLLKSQTFAQLGVRQLPTSVDNMSPGDPFLRPLNDLPIDSGITAYSIIACSATARLLAKQTESSPTRAPTSKGWPRNSWCARAIPLRVIPIPSKKYDGFFVSMSAWDSECRSISVK